MVLFKKIQDKVLSLLGQPEQESKPQHCGNLIALGVLLWAVAEADEKFFPTEKEKIEEILSKYCHVRPEDMSIVMRAVEEASFERIDIFQFAKDAGAGLSHEERLELLQHLFGVAYLDNVLSPDEEAMIRQISGHLGLEHQEFIDVKLMVKEKMNI